MQESLSNHVIQPTPKDTPEIRQAINSINDVICRYDDVVLRLSDRLLCITTPAPPIENAKTGAAFNTSLAIDLDCLRIRLRDITNDLESIYNRLEI